ncbi:hypothetical protein [Lacrimispora amygdalina]|uniref:hypothetical protein n=1 Tax=Lacrimispora amygdalina TaxID=253257 RepID=UPI001478B8F0|nr:hypothetical protein [Clostridium indicum]
MKYLTLSSSGITKKIVVLSVYNSRTNGGIKAQQFQECPNYLQLKKGTFPK